MTSAQFTHPLWLLFDVGNSRVKWALVQATATAAAPFAPLAQGAIVHAGDPARAVAALPADLPNPHAIWIANVTGEALASAFVDALRVRWPSCAPQLARVQARCAGLTVAYEDPSRLGVDRWLAMLALWTERPAEFVCVSCGTALTFDAVDRSGQHLGGIIAPGLLTAQQAVLGATRFASGAPELPDADVLGQNTEACVRQGALHACAGLIERLARRYAGESARQVIAGGDAQRLMRVIEGPWQLHDDLVLRGVLALAQIEQSSGRQF